MNRETKRNTRTGHMLRFMYLLSWVAFVGMAVKTGSLLVAWAISWEFPATAQKMYITLNMDALRETSFLHYSLAAALVTGFTALKAIVFLLLIKTLSKVNMVSPFTAKTASLIAQISYVLFAAWAVSELNKSYAKWLTARWAGVNVSVWPSDEILFMAGLVFIIAQIFKRGAELQSENELTV